MNAVERIQAAIDRLTTMDAERRYFEVNGWLVEYVTTGTEAHPQQEPAPLTSDELVVTLHRTIDAQLAILNGALVQWQMFVEGRYPDAPIALELALADALLGADS